MVGYGEEVEVCVSGYGVVVVVGEGVKDGGGYGYGGEEVVGRER